MKNIIAIYPGVFDPPTYGHLDVIKRASYIFSHVIVGVANTTSKDTWFDVDKRIAMVKEITKDIKGITVERFDELLVNYAKKKGVNVIIRGIRALSDFEYEFQMALTNRVLGPNIETIFLMPQEKYSYLSSSLIKEIASLKGDISNFVPPEVEQEIRNKCK